MFFVALLTHGGSLVGSMLDGLGPSHNSGVLCRYGASGVGGNTPEPNPCAGVCLGVKSNDTGD